MVTVKFDASDLKILADPQLIAQAEAQMIERGVEILQPLARSEAPSRTGRGRAQIVGVTDRRGGHLIGRVHVGKAFYLRILQTGTYKKPSGYDISTFRYAANRRASQRKAKQAFAALGPGRARGAIRALRFRAGGGFIFRGSVHRQALTADPWMDRAAEIGEPRVAVAAEAVAQAALSRATRG